MGSCNDGGLHEAICNSVNAGVTYVVAAGNKSDDAANQVLPPMMKLLRSRLWRISTVSPVVVPTLLAKWM